MKVVTIEPLDKRRRKILFEDNSILVLYGGEIRKYKIEAGDDLSQSVYDEIITTILCKRARERMIYLLKASDKTEAEIRKKLTDGYYPEPAIESAIAFAKSHRYIDDAGYAERYVRYQGKRKSRKQLIFDLQRKGIDRDIIRYILEDSPVDEEQQVRSYLKKKGLSGRELSREERQKASMALVRRGIPWEVIRRVLEMESDEIY